MLEKLKQIGIVPVIKIDDAQKAVPLAEALIKGGLPCAEVTFRTAAAAEAIKRISDECEQMLVGAGTVLTCEQADQAIAAGAKFIVSPGLNPSVVKHCLDKGVPIFPGCSTPSDIERALELGLKTVKFFPAEANGGIAAIKAMAAPYSGLSFMPTGGINTKNLNDYLAFAPIVACGGSWMVAPELIAADDFEAIERLTRAAVNTMLGFELGHVGINSEDEAQADKTARLFAGIFGFDYKMGNSSIYAGIGIEVMKTKFLGANGHIAIRTNSVDRAVYHLGAGGVEFDMSTAKRDAKGALTAVYLKNEFGGFAVHLVRK